MLSFVLINSFLLNLLCVWILFYNASSHSCFRSFAWNVDLIRPFYRPVRKTENLDFWKPVDNLEHFSGGISVCLRVKSSTHIRCFFPPLLPGLEPECCFYKTTLGFESRVQSFNSHQMFLPPLLLGFEPEILASDHESGALTLSYARSRCYQNGHLLSSFFSSSFFPLFLTK